MPRTPARFPRLLGHADWYRVRSERSHLVILRRSFVRRTFVLRREDRGAITARRSAPALPAPQPTQKPAPEDYKELAQRVAALEPAQQRRDLYGKATMFVAGMSAMALLILLVLFLRWLTLAG